MRALVRDVVIQERQVVGRVVRQVRLEIARRRHPVVIALRRGGVVAVCGNRERLDLALRAQRVSDRLHGAGARRAKRRMVHRHVAGCRAEQRVAAFFVHGRLRRNVAVGERHHGGVEVVRIDAQIKRVRPNAEDVRGAIEHPAPSGIGVARDARHHLGAAHRLADVDADRRIQSVGVVCRQRIGCVRREVGPEQQPLHVGAAIGCVIAIRADWRVDELDLRLPRRRRVKLRAAVAHIPILPRHEGQRPAAGRCQVDGAAAARGRERELPRAGIDGPVLRVTSVRVGRVGVDEPAGNRAAGAAIHCDDVIVHDRLRHATGERERIEDCIDGRGDGRLQDEADADPRAVAVRDRARASSSGRRAGQGLGVHRHREEVRGAVIAGTFGDLGHPARAGAECSTAGRRERGIERHQQRARHARRRRRSGSGCGGPSARGGHHVVSGGACDLHRRHRVGVGRRG
jgi:hypothetical protein